MTKYLVTTKSNRKSDMTPHLAVDWILERLTSVESQPTAKTLKWRGSSFSNCNCLVPPVCFLFFNLKRNTLSSYFIYHLSLEERGPIHPQTFFGFDPVFHHKNGSCSLFKSHKTQSESFCYFSTEILLKIKLPPKQSGI